MGRDGFLIFLGLCLFVGGQDVHGSSKVDESKGDLGQVKKERLPKELYEKAHKFLKNSKAFHNYTLEDLSNWIDSHNNWKAPDDLVKRFPYYFAGYDFDDRPVWVVEGGKYNLTSLIRDSSKFPIMLRMGYQGGIHVFKSMIAKDTPEKEVRQVTGLIDCEGLNMAQFTEVLENPEAIIFGLTEADRYLDILEWVLAQVIVINANYAINVYADLARPIVGTMMERVNIIGNNKYKWKAELRRILPEETIPSWYGGPADFKPLAVYG